MKTVIYKMHNLEVVRIVDDAPDFSSLKDDEDFMPVSLWNQGSDVEKINL